MTPEQVKELMKLKKTYDKAMQEIYDFCRPIGMALGYETVSDVIITETTLFFIGEWHGDYQSHDTEQFDFPVELLSDSDGIAKATKLIKDKIEKRRLDYEKDRQERAKAEEKKKYLELKNKFEGRT